MFIFVRMQQQLYNFQEGQRYEHNVYERGGGVFIAVKRSVTAELIPLNDSGLEQIFVKIKGFGHDIIIGYVYVPPYSRVEVYYIHLSAITYIKNAFANSKLLIFGDYNICSSLPQLECHSLLHEKYLLVGCLQHNIIRNDNGRILDLCFSDLDIIDIVEKTLAIVGEDKYHPAISAQFKFYYHLNMHLKRLIM